MTDWRVETFSSCLCSSFYQSSRSSMKCPLTYNFVSGFLEAFFLSNVRLHFSKCGVLAFLAYFLSTLLLITFVRTENDVWAAATKSVTQHERERGERERHKDEATDDWTQKCYVTFREQDITFDIDRKRPTDTLHGERRSNTQKREIQQYLNRSWFENVLSLLMQQVFSLLSVRQ